jgi:plasmid stability protein
MKSAADSKRTLVNLPGDIRKWLETRAQYHGASMSAEVIMSLRAAMERDHAAPANRRANAAE